MNKKLIIFGPWCGEFCYELSWWIPEIRSNLLVILHGITNQKDIKKLKYGGLIPFLYQLKGHYQKLYLEIRSIIRLVQKYLILFKKKLHLIMTEKQ